MTMADGDGGARSVVGRTASVVRRGAILATARPRVEESLERFVRSRRFDLAVVVPLVGAALLAAGTTGVIPRGLAAAPPLLVAGTLAMRLPLVAGLLPALDRRAVAGLAALAAWAYGVEAVAVATGWPYGHFEYGVALGPRVAGVPAALALFYLPLVANAYLLALLLLGPRARRRAVRLPAALAVLLAVDLVLDPAAVAVGFWSYAAGGPYYGVPLSNFAGWVLTGGVSVAVLDATLPRDAVRTRVEGCEFALDDLVSFVVLWGLLNVAAGNWVPVGVTVAFVAGLVWVDRFDVVGVGR